jgi:single-strand DNA-binding protein
MKRLTITGNLGHDPELRITPEGKTFGSFSVAVSVGTKQNPKTDWVEVNCNEKLADIIIKYCKKGNKVLVDGFPSVKAYIRNENVPVAVQRLYATSIEILNRTPLVDLNQDISGDVSIVETNLNNEAAAFNEELPNI